MPLNWKAEREISLSTAPSQERQLVNGGNIPARVREAFRLALEERPGAVHLELPEDVAAEEVEADLFHVPDVRRPSPDPKAIQRAADMLRAAKSPLLLIGAAGNRHRTGRAVRQFVDKTGIHVFCTQMGIGVVDANHPHFMGTAALSDHDYLHCAIERADLIVNIGHDVVEKPPFFMHEGEAKVIHVNYLSAEIDPVYFPQLEVIGDIANSVRAIGQEIGSTCQWDYAYFGRVKEEMHKHMLKGVESTDFPVKPQRLVADVRAALPEDGILTLDNGVYKIWFARNFVTSEPNGLLLDNALASMGAGLPSAMAAKMVHPERKVMTVCGDGGFMMNSQELETAVRLGLDLVVVILNDSAYGMIKWKQAAMKFKDFGLDYKNPDFPAYAKSYGANGVRLQRTEDLRGMLEDCLGTPGVHVIDVPVDYSENQKVLIDELQALTCIL